MQNAQRASLEVENTPTNTSKKLIVIYVIQWNASEVWLDTLFLFTT